ncbi:PaaI family thioesterase [Bacteroidia bacterium]|nr:PaaI family thioesterase [Bacteroidia bacterium]MDB9882831.1 PaaI family thioesterase [Bacteroidia bacterium]MDC1394945.1 PaaI family thioesterase [Bacteroidia bacterium]
MIPYKAINISQLNEFGKNTLAEHLQMEVTEVAQNHVTMRMPVTTQVQQPLGMLHGGAVAALAENVASLAGNLVANEQGKVCLGLSLNTNHLKSVRDGMVYATARPIHLGRSTQVWEIETKTEEGVLINVCRMTLAVVDKK